MQTQETGGGHRAGRRGWDQWGEQHGNTCITVGNIARQWECAVWPRELQPALCGTLERACREAQREGPYAYPWLSHAGVWWKPKVTPSQYLLLHKTDGKEVIGAPFKARQCGNTIVASLYIPCVGLVCLSQARWSRAGPAFLPVLIFFRILSNICCLLWSSFLESGKETSVHLNLDMVL